MNKILFIGLALAFVSIVAAQSSGIGNSSSCTTSSDCTAISGMCCATIACNGTEIYNNTMECLLSSMTGMPMPMGNMITCMYTCGAQFIQMIAAISSLAFISYLFWRRLAYPKPLFYFWNTLNKYSYLIFSIFNMQIQRKF